MFEQLKDSFVDTKKKRLLHIYQSLNEPMVSVIAGESAQPARAFILVVQPSSGYIEVFVGLFFAGILKRVLYSTSPFQVELYSDKLNAALDFSEQMGFIMDNLNFDKASENIKSNLVRTIPFLYEDLSLYAKALNTNEAAYQKLKAEEIKKDTSGDIQQAFLEQYLKIVSML